ncbi:MAG: patatin-like phospholipase family protein [Thermoanaerobaculia bacterium]
MEKPAPVSPSTTGGANAPTVDVSHGLFSLPALPLELKEEEERAIRRRRTSAGLPEECGPHVGLALSGGGIRSATFSLGILQALARHRLLRRFDYLSTVSGGGYLGGFLGRLFTRPKEDLVCALPKAVQPPAENTLSPADLVERILTEPGAKPISFLRENGRYLSPTGAGDSLLAGAVILRNAVSVHVVLGVLLVSVFLLLEAFGLLRGDALLHAALFSGLAAVASGILYWVGQPLLGLARDPFPARRFNNQLSRATLFFLLAALGLLALAGVGWLASLVHQSFAHGVSLRQVLNTVVGAVGILAAVRSLFRLIPTGEGRVRIPVGLLAAIFALLLTAILLTFWAVAAIALGKWAGAGIWWAFAIAFGLTVLMGRTLPFLNQSSLQALYGARLSRAYLGASNPERWIGSGQNVTEAIRGDGCSLNDYRPHEAGGPLHLLNVTLNETVAGKSQVEQRDRKGLALSIGPYAVSAAKRSHALRVTEEDPRMVLRPLEAPRSEYAIFTQPTDASLLHAEPLSLETWISISGAAFSTGLGSRTSLGFSLLCGLFNVRLGYWWDSGIDPEVRAGRSIPSLPGRLHLLFDKLLPVQMHLLDEFLARFPGPNSRLWYLSDGGHFENTACYELIRRRLPLIVLCDDGADPEGRFDDLANLVRKARIDFRTEITFLTDADLADEPAGRFFGAMDALTKDSETGFARRHAALARIRYPDGTDGLLVVLKPTLTGDEPLDLLDYRALHPAFPQEPTSDQFFDEAQWESYRKLGERIGEGFAEALADRPLAPESFLPGAAPPRTG